MSESPATTPLTRFWPHASGGRFPAQAVLVGTGIDLTALGATERTGGAPLVVDLTGAAPAATVAGSGAGVAVLFRYGAVVFFAATPAASADYLATIAPQLRQPFPPADRETESLELRVEPAAKEAIDGSALVLADASLEKHVPMF